MTRFGQGWVVAVVLLGWCNARADSSVVKPAPADSGWCLARYLKESGQPAPKTAIAPVAKPASFTLGPALVRFDLPTPLTATLIDGQWVQVVPGAPNTLDQFTLWEPTLQVRWQTRAELEARVKAITSDFMGRTQALIEVRAATVQGKPAEELCAVVRRTPGHATLIDGTHRPMPEIVEWVHGYLFARGDRTLTAVYRLPPGALEQRAMWEQLLASLRF